MNADCPLYSTNPSLRNRFIKKLTLSAWLSRPVPLAAAFG